MLMLTLTKTKHTCNNNKREKKKKEKKLYEEKCKICELPIMVFGWCVMAIKEIPTNDYIICRQS